MISIEAGFNLNELEKMIEDDLQEWFKSIASELFETAKKQVDKAIAKAKPTEDTFGKAFGNITFNLRSSIGCGSVINGVLQETYFPYGKGDEGQANGLELLKSLVEEANEEICVIVVAGEKYGIFVQSKGFDVLEMARGTFDDELKNVLTR